ncbi:hybrid sensor histidine kinase/response regulator [Sphingomonas phyllosphaerae]|uniref:hybrid sensor histidine kinase/response regulator n=1 Tax=Sphingomonas phyllosphaerae TaxID=257003 RepID=UPI0006848D26|nr:PAS domain-containing sensor histidine kinase [Sphingomonas phyllosphaerae]
MTDLPSTTPDDLRPGLRFLAGGGAATGLILARDWRDHPLGLPENWPAPFKAALSLVLNSPESMILCWDADELFFFFNETYFPLLGPRLDWAMGTPMRDVWADAWEQARPIVDDAFAGRSRRFVDLPWKLSTDRGAADTWWSFSYSRILDEQGERAGLFIFTNETTQRVLADRALLESRAQLVRLNADLAEQVAQRTAERDRMWNASPDLMVVVSTDGRYLAVNPAWTDILGYQPAELLGIDALSLVHPEDLPAAVEALAAAQAGTMPTFETRFRHHDGSYRWLQWVAAPGEAEVFAIGRHVTEAKEAAEQLKRATEQLSQAQKMEAIGQLTGGVAHDFNNLLTIIRGSVELLRRPDLAPDKRDRYVEAIGETATRATKLTGQLLAFARRQALTPELLDVGVAVGEIAEMVQTLIGARVALHVEAPAMPCLAEIDRSQFETALVNLAINARDAMEGQGMLRVAIAPVGEIPSLRGHHGVSGEFVAVAVIDDGAGIPPEALPHIFEPFFTTKGVGKGTGLGLSQVIGFAKQSGGDISVTSEPGQGTTFTLYLPRVTEGRAAADRSEEDGPADGQGAYVLLIEDNEEVGQFATAALNELGYRSLLATNAYDALSILETDAARFDVVFSDVVMPGMNGVECATRIRERHPALPIVLTSGYAHVLAENWQHGFELLHKPYSMEQLSRTLRRAVARGARARGE